MRIIQKDSQAWGVPSTGVPPDTIIVADIPPGDPAVDFLKLFFGAPLRTLLPVQDITIVKKQIDPVVVVVRRTG